MELSRGLEVLELIASRLTPIPGKLLVAVKQLTSTGGQLGNDAFQMSFSRSHNELGQWRGYVANGLGCSVVTEVSDLTRVADVAGCVVYDPTHQEKFAEAVLRDLAPETDADTIAKTLVAAACFMKHDGFQVEDEFRVVVFPEPHHVQFREAGDRMIPFVDFLKISKESLPINRVIIGPGWQLSRLSPPEFALNHVVQSVARLFEARGAPVPVIHPSSIPYDPK
jgi:hypothetical protein